MTRRSAAYFVQSLERGLEVIRVFGSDAPALSIAEVAQRANIPRPAARRFLLTLVDLGYASQEGKCFRLRPKVLDLGFAYLLSLDVWRLGQAYLDGIAQEAGETCSISILDGTEIVYVARTYVQRVISAEIGVGSRLPAFATSMGRVLLASLSEEAQRKVLSDSQLRPLTPNTVYDLERLIVLFREVASAGYALVDQELVLGLRSIAVPIRNRRGRVVAAMSISSHAWRVTKEQLIHTHLPLLLTAAEEMAPKLVA